jgi:hypothetical protein
MPLGYCIKRGADIFLDLTMFMFAHREPEVTKIKSFQPRLWPCASSILHRWMDLNQDHVMHMASLFTVSFFNKFLSHMKKCIYSNLTFYSV